MATRTVSRSVGLAVFLAGAFSTALVAQATNAPRLLDARAAQAFEAGTPAKYQEAGELWRQAALRYLDNGWTADAAAAFRNAGLAQIRAGADSTALEYYGRAAELEDPAASYQVRVLLARSPLYDPANRGAPDEARFIGSVNQLLAAVSPGARPAASAAEAQVALENLARSSLAPITLRRAGASVDVQFRRSTYAQRQPGALWERAATDTTVHRQPAAYDFKYRLPGHDKDTVVTMPCADGCTLVIH